MAEARVVAVVGPRQAGKSTLVRALVEGLRGQYETLDEATTFDQARADPQGFVKGLRRPAAIDEAQRVPEVFRAIKLVVDRDNAPGQFIVTGSADPLATPALAGALAGRVELLTLWPFAQAELERRSGTFTDQIFGKLEIADARGEVRTDAIARAIAGGFPEAVARAAESRGSWFESHVTTVLQRDVRDIAAIEQLAEMPRLLRLLAGRTATALNVADLSRTTGLKHTTLTRYLALLEVTYLLMRLPAWGRGIRRRLLRHPKIVLTDTGVMAQLQGIDADRFGVDDTLAGPLLENFVAMELVKLSGWSEGRPTVLHYRSPSAAEVDFVLERRDGSIVGVEVKASTSVREGDLAGLRALERDAGKRFVRGVVLYCGRRALSFGRTLAALPISVLWRS